MFHFCNCLLCIVKENINFFMPLALISVAVGVFALEWMTNILQTTVKKHTIPFVEKNKILCWYTVVFNLIHCMSACHFIFLV